MSQRLLLFGLVFAGTLAAEVRAEPTGRWWSGWGMGVTEYGFTKDDKNYILISCDPHGKTNISLSIGGKSPRPRSTVVMKVNGQALTWLADSRGNLPTDSHVESSKYYSLLEEIRLGSGKIGIFFNGLKTAYPLTGSAKALPRTPCPSDFGK